MINNPYVGLDASAYGLTPRYRGNFVLWRDYMKIKVVFNDKAEYKICSLTFMFAGERITLTSKDQTIECGTTVMEDICIEKNAVDRIDHLEHMELVEMLLMAGQKKIYWAEIKAIYIKEDNRHPFELMSSRFARYQYREISEPGFFFKLLESDYQKIAAYVRQQDKRQNAVNALSCMNNLNQNIVEYLKGYDIKEFSEHFDELTDYTGEEEQCNVEDYINNRCGGIVYPIFISDKDTEDELRQVVPLLRVQYEKILSDMQEYWNGCPGPEAWGGTWMVLSDEDDDNVFLKAVDEIILPEEESNPM